MRVGDDLPRLRFLLWSRVTVEVSEEEAFALYEGNRQWVDRATMGERERRLVGLSAYDLEVVERVGLGS
jgi:hypothetical protein